MAIKWVSPTGMTVMHEDADGTVRYEFPTVKHPQLPQKNTSNAGTYGLKAKANAAQVESTPT